MYCLAIWTLWQEKISTKKDVENAYLLLKTVGISEIIFVGKF